MYVPVRWLLVPGPTWPPLRQPARPAGLRSRWPAAPERATGGLPVLGTASPFQYGAAVIDPGAAFFRAGNPIGGPASEFRGIAASRVPFFAADQGPGGPLSVWLVGIAGAPIL